MRVLVVDDETLARNRLTRMLGRIEGVEVAGEAADGVEALRKIKELCPDVVFLDIRMPGLDGLTLASTVPDLPPIVFTTAYDEYAVRAFDASAADYLMKPIEADRLEQAVERVRSRSGGAGSARLRTLLDELARRDGPDLVRITARSRDAIRVFDPAAITRFRSEDKVTVFRHGGEEFLLDESLQSLEERLARFGFFRAHRGELVNLHHVLAVRTEDDATRVELADGQTAAVSRRSVAELKRRLGM